MEYRKKIEIGTRIKVLSGFYKGCKGTVIEKAKPCEFDADYLVQKVQVKTLEHNDTIRYCPEVSMLVVL